MSNVSIFKSFSFVVLVFLAASCRKSLPVLDGLDKDKWASDRHGCTGARTAMMPSLKGQESKLLALTETEIIEILGSPDENELYKRNQKFYYYDISPSGQCNSGSSEKYRLMIRFNAMGLAKEVSIVQD